MGQYAPIGVYKRLCSALTSKAAWNITDVYSHVLAWLWQGGREGSLVNQSYRLDGLTYTGTIFITRGKHSLPCTRKVLKLEYPVRIESGDSTSSPVVGVASSGCGQSADLA